MTSETDVYRRHILTSEVGPCTERVKFSRRGKIREFKNLAKIIIIVATPKKKENSRILASVKSPKISNSRKFKHAKITRYILYQANKTLTQCRLNAGPPSTTLTQHPTDIDSTYCVFWVRAHLFIQPSGAGALGYWLAPLPFTLESSGFGSRSRRFERNKKCFFPIHV